MSLRQSIPLLRQLDGYDRPTLRSDLSAGLTTAVMLVPQSMAYALLAGLNPVVGLYAATLPLALYALFGSSRTLAIGPAAMVSLLVAAALSESAGGDPVLYAALASVLALLVGLVQFSLGAARLGFVVKFLSQPVIAGFSSAVAILIGVSQLKHLVGIDLPRSANVLDMLLAAAQRIGEVHTPTLAIAVGSAAALVALKTWAPRVPRFLVVVVAGSVLVKVLALDEAGVAVVGSVPGGLPQLTAPRVDFAAIRELFPAAITIALLGFMESISVAKRLARRNGQAVDADQELKGLGLANIGSAFVQGYPITGGFSRSVVHAEAGARTGVAGLFTAAAVTLTLLFLTPLFAYMPTAVLAAIIVTAVVGLVDVKEARHLWNVSRPDLVAMGVSFGGTLVLGVQQGLLMGIATSLAWFIWRTSRPHVAILGQLPGSTVYRNVERYPDALIHHHFVALRIDAPLYFANTAFLKRTILDALEHDTAHLIIDCKAISSVDAQALATLEEVIDELDTRDITLWLAGVRGPVRDALEAANLRGKIGEDRLVERCIEAVDAVRHDAPKAA
ncbi:MAG: sulfate permease [Proteobacteria bacterium]|nr:sulfate permease [Pseudomonadota bacterium]